MATKNEEMIQKLEEIMKKPGVSDKAKKMYQEKIAQLKKTEAKPAFAPKNFTKATSNGSTIFGKLLASKDSADPTAKKPSFIHVLVINTTTKNDWKTSSDFGEIMEAKDIPSYIDEQNQEEKKKNAEHDSFRVLNADNEDFVFTSVQPAEMVLVLKVRGKTAAKSDFGKKPMFCFMIVTNLSKIWLSIFEPKIEKVVNGDYVNLTGVSAMDYEGSVRLSCKNISKSMYDKDKVDAEMMKYFLQKFPRFTNPYLEITEDELTKEERDNRSRQLSRPLRDFLNTPMHICSWPTTNEDEILKPESIVFSEPILVACSYEAGQEPDKKTYNQLTFQQMLVKTDESGTKKIALNIKIGGPQATTLLGITNTATFGKIAKIHVPRMRFTFFCYPNQDGTRKLHINNESTKPEEYSDVDFGIECMTNSSTTIMTNLVHYLLSESLQIDFVTAKKLLGENLKFTIQYDKNPNTYNATEKLVNLSEFTGELNKFKTGFVFRILTVDKATAINKIKNFSANSEERMKKTIADLMGLTTKADDIILEKCDKTSTDAPFVIFAIADSLVELYKKKSEKFTLNDVYDDIENRHKIHGTPIPTETSNDEEKQEEKQKSNGKTGNSKRKRDSEETAAAGSGDGGDNDEEKKISTKKKSSSKQKSNDDDDNQEEQENDESKQSVESTTGDGMNLDLDSAATTTSTSKKSKEKPVEQTAKKAKTAKKATKESDDESEKKEDDNEEENNDEEKESEEESVTTKKAAAAKKKAAKKQQKEESDDENDS